MFKGNFSKITPAIIAFLIGMIITLASFQLSLRLATDEIIIDLEDLVKERNDVLLTEAATLTSLVNGISGFFAASNYVDGDEFATYIKTAFPDQQYSHTVIWSPVVEYSQLADFERRAKQEGAQSLKVSAFDPHQASADDSAIAGHLPVQHIYASGATRPNIQGVDLATAAHLQQPLKEAIESKTIIGRYGRVIDDQQTNGTISLFSAVFRAQKSAETSPGSTQSLLGFIIVETSIAEFIEHAFISNIPSAGGLDAYAFNTEADNPELLYFHASRERMESTVPLELNELLADPFTSRAELKFAGNNWTIFLQPIPGKYNPYQTLTPWITLTLSLLFTLLVTVYIYRLRIQKSAIEDTVKSRSAELSKSQERIEAIVNTVVDSIISIDSKGIITTFNPAAVKIFGYSEEEAIGNNVKLLMPEHYRAQHDQYISNFMSTHQAKVIGIGREVTGLRKDGSTFPMELAVKDMLFDGEQHFTGVVRDITEQKNIERAKSEFISTMSHELRTPLTSIQGALGLVLGKAGKELPEKVLKMLELANRNCERLTRLINDILDMEKIKSGKMGFDFAAVDLIELSENALAENQGYAESHQVSLKLICDLAQASVWADPQRMLQVFANLISNAIKFSPPNATVEIIVSQLNNQFRVAVKDHGPGIPEEFREQLFERFTQADSSDTKRRGGTGLGLNISKEIMTRHDGLLDYETETGKGTTFYFDLPRQQPSVKAELPAAGGARALICEDNEDVALILADILSDSGIASDTVKTAKAAREKLKEGQYKVLLLDLTLPDGSGIDLLKDIRSEDDNPIPVIVVSGRAMEGKAECDHNYLNVIDWLQKPLDITRLQRALTNILSLAHQPRILHVEDDLDVAQIVSAALGDQVDYKHAATLEEARQLLEKNGFDLVILDLSLPDGPGSSLLNNLHSCPVIVFSGEEASAPITDLVVDYLVKSKTSNEQLVQTIDKIVNPITNTGN